MNRTEIYLQEFQALRHEMQAAINARLWGTFTFLVVAGGASALYASTNDPTIFLLVIWTAVPLQWHTANRERARVRIGAYIGEVLEKALPELSWEQYLQKWRTNALSSNRIKLKRDHLRNMFGLSGVYLIILAFTTYMLIEKSTSLAVELSGAFGFLVNLEATHYLHRIQGSMHRYRKVFKKSFNEFEKKKDQNENPHRSMAKKSSTETKSLKDSCVGTIKELEGDGFTCKNKDGEWITCIPSGGSTSSCWVSKAPVDTDALQGLVRAQIAIEAAIEEIVAPILPTSVPPS